jgi:hypothetical protein
MIRRFSIVALTVSMIAPGVPASSFADENSRTASDHNQVSGAVPASHGERRIAHETSRPQAAPPLNLRNATRAIALDTQTRPQTTAPPRFLGTPRGKATVAVAVIVATVFVGYAASQGPEPTLATAK